MTDYHLIALTVIICGVAVCSRNTAAMWFAGLAAAHEILFRNFHGSGDAVAWAFSAGMFSAMSLAACIYYRAGVNDNVAFYLAITSFVWILVNVLHIVLWVTYAEVVLLNPIFAILHMATIFTIVFGGGGDIDTSRVSNRSNLAYRFYDSCRAIFSKLVHSEKAK